MLKYESLSPEISKRIEEDRLNGTTPNFAFGNNKALRRDSERDKATVLRPPFIRDIDKIMHCPYYNRYADKTQVLSFYKNDDITRRGLHVQLVSRIARTIGSALGLNLDLIEAIALGHDIGHTPFGHAGETFLDELLFENTGNHFSHNIHSIRVLDKIFPYNISLQTLNGIAAHDGEMELSEYKPKAMQSFSEFDSEIDKCYNDKKYIKKLAPCTLEGCVMRISDIIAYLGKDRQDAMRTGIADSDIYENGALGITNAEIINNLIVNIVENSYGKPYIKMDEEHFNALKKAKSDNYELIYKAPEVDDILHTSIKPMMQKMYERLLHDLLDGTKKSPILTHHIAYINKVYYKREQPYTATEPNMIVADYIASMTDDYFIDLYEHLFPKSNLKVNYKGYFD